MNKLISFESIFDNVLCLTLEGQVERQESVDNELNKVGVKKYDFIYGVTPKAEIFNSHLKGISVVTFPPCFRCGLTNCNCENNFLTDAQVAVFFSYIKIWEKVASLESRLTLIVEDDVFFSELSPKKLLSIASLCENVINNVIGEPLLIRFGWARTKEHRLKEPFQLVEGLTKMSNPCHAINSEMARLLLKKLERIDTTSDIYLHSIVGSQVKNYTVFPPIASDLSWSNGVFPSLIHPKENHIKYLRIKYFMAIFFNKKMANKLKGDICELRNKIEGHVKRVEQFEFCIVGHPRCGSGYMASLFQSFGCNIGHEAVYSHGISSWMFVVDDKEYPFAFDLYAKSRRFCRFKYHVLHLRSLTSAVSSVCLENEVINSYEFRRHHIKKELDLDLDLFSSRLEKALISICAWIIIAEKLNPCLRIKIEDSPVILRDFLYDKGYTKAGDVFDLPDQNINSHKKFNGMQVCKPVINKSEWVEALRNKVVYSMVEEYCVRYGYDFSDIKKIVE